MLPMEDFDLKSLSALHLTMSFGCNVQKKVKNDERNLLFSLVFHFDSSSLLTIKNNFRNSGGTFENNTVIQGTRNWI